jgi:hypothetical protein
MSLLVSVTSALDDFWMRHRFSAISCDSTQKRLYGTYYQTQADGTERVIVHSAAFWLEVIKYPHGKEFSWEIQSVYGSGGIVNGFHFMVTRDRGMRISRDSLRSMHPPTHDEIEILISFLRR